MRPALAFRFISPPHQLLWAAFLAVGWEWLVMGGMQARAQDLGSTILLQDSFDLTKANPNSLDVNFQLLPRQGGPLAPVSYTKGLEGTFSQVGNVGTTNQLLLAGRAAGSGGAVSLDHDFVEVPGFGASSVLQFDVNPVLRVAGVNQSPASWIAVTFGSGFNTRNQFPQFVDGIGLLFRGNGQYGAINAGTGVASGPYLKQQDHTFHHVRITLTEPVHGNPFSGNLPVWVEAFIDGSETPLFSFVRTNGFTHNYLSFIGEGEGSGGDGVVRHLVDNLVLSLEPARRPILTVTLAGQIADLSWSASASNFRVYSATTLTPPIFWTAVTNPVLNDGAFSAVSIPIGGESRFFQLQR
ncbi:MAG TPA: hypothetical protein VMF06_15305 [Candidatus Limnocylindria bacterium]|jgi:hypothetical protein|nr:hypothetical protein [Candidatus Limnocylindria bacterium]